MQTENWMGLLPEIVALRLITELCLPSSHDSASFKLNALHPIVTGDAPFLRLSYLLWPPSSIKHFTECWVLTQNLNIYDQLKSGIRVLDFRIAFDGEELWLVHAFSLIKLSDALRDVKKFIDTHPTEVVIIRTVPGWEHRNTMISETMRLETLVLDILGENNLITQNNAMPTLRECQQPGSPRILFVYNIPGKYFWPTSIIQGFWGTTNNINELNDEITSVKSLTKIPYIFQEVSFTLTPTGNDVKASLFKYLTFQKYESLKTFAAATNKLLIEDLKTDPVNFSKFSMITMDYPTQEAIIAIIALNYR